MSGTHIIVRPTAVGFFKNQRVDRRKRQNWLLAVAFFAFFGATNIARGQDIQVTTPLVGVNDSYYEAMGVSWGFQFGGPSSQVFGSFNQGSAGSAIPPFGGYDPNASARFGFGSFNNNGGGFSLGLEMGKGSTRTMTSNSPSVVVPNGGVGSIFDGSFRPFVTGVIPVVGNPGDTVEPYTPPYQAPQSMGKRWSDVLTPQQESRPRPSSDGSSPNFSTENSSAQRGDLSVAELQAQRAAEESEKLSELDGFIAEAEAFEKDGKFSRARSSLRKAIKRADGRQRYDLQLKLESLLDK